MTGFMNKKVVAILLALILVLAVMPIQAVAVEVVASEIEYLPGGGYIETVTTESTYWASGMKTGSKVKRYVDSDGTELWNIRLQGTFSYTGTAATCTNAVCNVTVLANNWYVVSKSASKSGAKASADVTMGMKVLGITVSKSSYQLTLACDKNGNLT